MATNVGLRHFVAGPSEVGKPLPGFHRGGGGSMLDASWRLLVGWRSSLN